MEESTNPICEPFDFSEVPSWYSVCVNEQCPVSGQCMRYQVGLHAPAEIRARLCVMPGEWKDGTCHSFEEIRMVKKAFCFTRLYDLVLKRDYTAMRKELVEYFHGKRQYYWHMKGERALLPDQQDWMRQWLKEWGYDWELSFDRFEEGYIYRYNDLVK